jgi:hypothetical protein
MKLVFLKFFFQIFHMVGKYISKTLAIPKKINQCLTRLGTTIDDMKSLSPKQRWVDIIDKL